jgi:soluble lytic murein transglycosylase-like protein
MRAQPGRVGWLALAAVSLVIVTGCGLGHDNSNDTASNAGSTAAGSQQADPSEEQTLESTPEETTPAAPPPPTVKPKAKPKPKKTSAKPTEDPNNFQLPACAVHEGKKVTRAQAKAALTTAAGKIYWPVKAPTLKLTADLVKSIAWHESGWQSDVVNCDGGRGLMQVMPDTVDMINNRFGVSYDATDYKQNALAGANYLAWLTKYFSEKYFKDKYDLNPAHCTSHTKMCLLNMVIAAYNSGFGTVEDAWATKKLPNPEYVDSVRSLMTSCYCDRY